MVDKTDRQTAPLLVVALALVDRSGRVLLARRPPGRSMPGLWEFPGGKVEPGESPPAAIVREAGEELGIVVAEADLSPVSFATDDRPDRHLVLLLYRTSEWRGEPMPLVASSLKWVCPDEMATLAMPPADRPLVGAIARSIDWSGAAGGRASLLPQPGRCPEDVRR